MRNLTQTTYCLFGTFKEEYITYRGSLLVKAFTRVVEKVFQHFGDLIEGEAGFSVSLLGRMVPGWTMCPGSSEQKLLLLVLFEEQVVKEAFLWDRPVKLLKTAIGKELSQVHAIVHEKAYKVWLVIDQCIHHHLFKIASLQRSVDLLQWLTHDLSSSQL